MRFYANGIHEITNLDMAIFRTVRRIVEGLPDLVFDPSDRGLEGPNQLTCHLVAHAIASLIAPVKKVDGFFSRSYQHSWLRTSTSLIDVYPVAGGNPFIVAAGPLSPWCKWYVESDLLSSMFEKPEFIRRLAITRTELEKVATTNAIPLCPGQ